MPVVMTTAAKRCRWVRIVTVACMLSFPPDLQAFVDNFPAAAFCLGANTSCDNTKHAQSTLLQNIQRKLISNARKVTMTLLAAEVRMYLLFD